VQRGRGEPDHAREEVREETPGVAQEGPLGLRAAQLLEQGEGERLRVRELFERLVAAPPRVEGGVGVVDEAEQDRDSPFQGGEGGGMLGSGHPRFLSAGSRMAPVVPSIHATDI